MAKNWKIVIFGPKMAQKSRFLAKFQKSKKYILFVFLNPTIMPIFKRIEENGKDFYYFEEIFEVIFYKGKWAILDHFDRFWAISLAKHPTSDGHKNWTGLS